MPRDRLQAPPALYGEVERHARQRERGRAEVDEPGRGADDHGEPRSGERPEDFSHRRRGGAVAPGQWKRRNTRDPLVPPKPKEFESAASIFISRADPET